MGRAPCCEKVGLKRGRWTAEEDELLLKYITANGEGSWRSLPKNAGLLRCGKSCRLRWINYLRADLKRGNITKEEEETIIKMHASLGNRWSLIASHLPGRTDNEIKNYWNSNLGRRILTFCRANGSATAAGSGKGRSGRTSRSAMKKNKQAKGVPIIPTSHSSNDMVDLQPSHQSETEPVLGQDQEVEAGLLSPSQWVVDGGVWAVTDEVEAALIGRASEESVGCESIEGSMSGGGHALNDDGRDGGQMGYMDGRVVDLSEDGSASAQNILGWDLEDMASKLWDDAGEWPMLGESGDGYDLDANTMDVITQQQEELFSSWLLSDDL